MKNRLKKITSSTVLATLLLAGCGSGADPDTNTPSTGKIEIPASGKIESSTKEKLQSFLKTRNATYQSSSYSKDKKEILVAAIHKDKVTFYKFDASTLDFIDKFSFDIDGIIGIKTAQEGGKYTIISSKDSEAHDYLLDSTTGQLDKKGETYTLKDPKEIIQKQLGNTFHVNSFLLTPSKLGGLVVATNSTQTKLFLYGMEDPSNPLQEYAIFEGSNKDKIENIVLLGNGIITYEHRHEDTPNKVQLVTYDYFNKKKLSEKYVGETQVDANALKNLIAAQAEGGSVEDLIVTPTKLGAIATIKKEMTTRIYLYGLEDINHPKQEHEITKIDLSKSTLSDTKVLPDGIMTYTVIDNESKKETTVNYNYYKLKTVSTSVIEGSNDTLDMKKLEDEINAKYKAYYDTIPRWKKSGRTPVQVKVLGKMTETLYLLRVSTSFFDSSIATKVYDTTQAFKPKYHAHDYKKTLTYWRIGGGYEAQSVKIDKENHRVVYTINLRDHLGFANPEFNEKEYVTGLETRYYDYTTDTITEGILPVKLTIPAGKSSDQIPFYSPDKKFIFTKDTDDAYNETIDLYDAKGKFLKKIYTQSIPDPKYSSVHIENFTFGKVGELSFVESAAEYGTERTHQAKRERNVTINYQTAAIISQSPILYSISYKDTKFSPDKKSILKLTNDGLVTFDAQGNSAKLIFSTTKEDGKRFSYKGLEKITADNASFLQRVRENQTNTYFNFTINYHTGAIISKEQITDPAKIRELEKKYFIY